MGALVTRAIVGALLLVPVGALVAPASAAPPSKVSSDPEDGEELHRAPERVTITFDQPLDPDSYIHVENHCGDRVDEQPTEVGGNEMSVPVTGNWAGMHHVTYLAKGIGGITGQELGSFTFSVHAGAACDGSGGGHDHGGTGGGRHRGGHGGDGHQRPGDHSTEGHPGAGDHGMHGEGAPAPGGHESAAHRAATHSPGHGGKHGSGHGAHAGGGAHSDHHADRAGTERDETRHITSAPSGALRGPGSDVVMLSLGLCVLVGLLGGAVLRFSAPR